MTRVSNEEKAVMWHGENVLHFEASMNVTLGVPRIKETRQFGGCADVQHLCGVFSFGRRQFQRVPRF